MRATELSTKQSFTTDEARVVAAELGIDFGALGCDLEQFRMGLDVELEHGPRDPETDVSGNDPIVTGKIALAHLTEFPEGKAGPSRRMLAARIEGAREHHRAIVWATGGTPARGSGTHGSCPVAWRVRASDESSGRWQ